MSVERRYCKRHPMDGDVYIRYRKHRVFPARAVNWSVHGTYLQTESLSLLTGALVELEIFRDGRPWEVMGVVAHCQDEGIGVMFWQPQPELYESVVAGQRHIAPITRSPRAGACENHP